MRVVPTNPPSASGCRSPSSINLDIFWLKAEALEDSANLTAPEIIAADIFEDLIKRDKINLDIFWLKDEALEDSANLPAPEIIAADIVEDLQAALAQFAEIATDLKT